MRKIVLLFFIAGVVFCQSASLTELRIEIKDAGLAPMSELPVKSQSNKKNAAVAILYSMLLPGMGELYAGDYSSGKYFTIAEAGLWGTLIGLNYYQGWKEDNYKSFAKSRAGVSGDKDEQFYIDIGNYASIEAYNLEKELNREFSDRYNVQSDYWRWESAQQRREYRSMWLSAEYAGNTMKFVGAAMVLNRVLSAINAVRLVSKHNREIAGNEWGVSFSPVTAANIPAGMQLNFHTQL